MRSNSIASISLAFASCIATADAAQSVTIPINGVRIQNGLNQSRDSGAQTIDPAFRYSARFSENTTVTGSGFVLGALYPTPTPLSEVMEDFEEGSSSALTYSAANPSGTLPATLRPQVIDQETTLSGIAVEFGMTINAGASATGVCSFSLTNVVINPALLIGSLTVSQGSIIVTAHCLVDFNLDQGVTIDDLLAFLAFFEEGNVQGDLNRDEAITVDDLLSFLVAFENGC